MNKLNKSLLAVGVIALAAFQSCDDNDDVNVVPQVVSESFKTRFPDASRVEWEWENNYLVAEFHTAGCEAEAWFDADGKWYLTETDLPYSLLPQSVKSAFEQSAYAAWKVDDVDQVERHDEETVYVLEVESGKQEYELYYAVDGTLLKEQPDHDADHEYHP